MNKRSLIRIAVVGIASGVALVWAVPLLVDALSMASVQAATLPSNERQVSEKPSFVFPVTRSAPENLPPEAGRMDPSKPSTGSWRGPEPTTTDDRSNQDGSENLSPRFGEPEESKFLPGPHNQNQRPSRFVFPVPNNSAGDLSNGVPNNDRMATIGAEENSFDGAQTDRPSALPATNLRSGISSVSRRESAAPRERTHQTSEARHFVFPLDQRDSAVSQIGIEHDDTAAIPAAAEAEMDAQSNQGVYHREAIHPPSEIVSETREESVILPAMNHHYSEPSRWNLPVITSPSEDTRPAAIDMDNSAIDSAAGMEESATLRTRPSDQSTFQPPLPVMLRQRDHAAEGPHVTPSPPPNARQQNRRQPAIAEGSSHRALQPPR